MDRTRGIGGSDIAAIMGISPWNTAYGVYLDKIGEGKPIQGKHLELGHKAQGPILRKYEKESGYIVEAEDVEIVHPSYPFLIGHLDGVTDEGRIFIEVKTTSQGIDDWDYQIPPYYKTQVGFYAALGNPDRVEMPIAYWFNEDRLYDLKHYTSLTYWREEAFEQGILDLAVDFWENHVLKRRPPELRNLEDIKKRYALSLETNILASDEIKSKLIQLDQLQQQQKGLDEKEALLKFDIQQYMGDNACVVDENGKHLASFRSHIKHCFDSTRFRDDYPDLHQEYLKQSICRPFKLI